MEERIYSVGELNNYIKNLLDSDPVLGRVCVHGGSCQTIKCIPPATIILP